MPATEPIPDIPQNRFNPILDSDFVHNDDVVSHDTVLFKQYGRFDPGFVVNVITVDWQAVANRNTAEIHKSIRLRKEREERQAKAAAEFTESLAVA